MTYAVRPECQATRARRGVALVAVLWAVALLATATAIASSSARTNARITANARAQAIARSMAESGVVAAVATIDDSLLALSNAPAQRDAFLLSLEPQVFGARPLVEDSLGDGAFAATVVDVSARLDVNNSDASGLAQLFATVTSPALAQQLGARIEAMVRGDVGANARDDQQRAADSLRASLLGRETAPRLRRTFESLDELRDALSRDDGAANGSANGTANSTANSMANSMANSEVRETLDRVAEQLTVDGDGHVNRRAASKAVLAAASGSLVDAPTRLLIVARGWQRGHPLTRQIEAVYDITPSGLQLVRWREHDR